MNIKMREFIYYAVQFLFQGDNLAKTTGKSSHDGYQYWSRNYYPSGTPEFTPGFLVGFMLLDLYFYVYVLQIVVCPFVFFSFGHCVVCLMDSGILQTLPECFFYNGRTT